VSYNPSAGALFQDLLAFDRAHRARSSLPENPSNDASEGDPHPESRSDGLAGEREISLLDASRTSRVLVEQFIQQFPRELSDEEKSAVDALCSSELQIWMPTKTHSDGSIDLVNVLTEATEHVDVAPGLDAESLSLIAGRTIPGKERPLLALARTISLPPFSAGRFLAVRAFVAAVPEKQPSIERLLLLMTSSRIFESSPQNWLESQLLGDRAQEAFQLMLEPGISEEELNEKCTRCAYEFVSDADTDRTWMPWEIDIAESFVMSRIFGNLAPIAEALRYLRAPAVVEDLEVRLANETHALFERWRARLLSTQHASRGGPVLHARPPLVSPVDWAKEPLEALHGLSPNRALGLLANTRHERTWAEFAFLGEDAWPEAARPVWSRPDLEALARRADRPAASAFALGRLAIDYGIVAVPEIAALLSGSDVGAASILLESLQAAPNSATVEVSRAITEAVAVPTGALRTDPRLRFYAIDLLGSCDVTLDPDHPILDAPIDDDHFEVQRLATLVEHRYAEGIAASLATTATRDGLLAGGALGILFVAGDRATTKIAVEGLIRRAETVDIDAVRKGLVFRLVSFFDAEFIVDRWNGIDPSQGTGNLTDKELRALFRPNVDPEATARGERCFGPERRAKFIALAEAGLHAEVAGLLRESALEALLDAASAAEEFRSVAESLSAGVEAIPDAASLKTLPEAWRRFAATTSGIVLAVAIRGRLPRREIASRLGDREFPEELLRVDFPWVSPRMAARLSNCGASLERAVKSLANEDPVDHGCRYSEYILRLTLDAEDGLRLFSLPLRAVSSPFGPTVDAIARVRGDESLPRLAKYFAFEPAVKRSVCLCLLTRLGTERALRLLGAASQERLDQDPSSALAALQAGVSLRSRELVEDVLARIRSDRLEVPTSQEPVLAAELRSWLGAALEVFEIPGSPRNIIEAARVRQAAAKAREDEERKAKERAAASVSSASSQAKAAPQAAARKPAAAPATRARPSVGRNDPCPCGSGKKFKKCCGAAG
jgi:hypothetical protein